MVKYILYPYYTQSVKSTIRDYVYFIFKSYFSCFACIALAGVFILAFDYLITNAFDIPSIQLQIKKHNHDISFKFGRLSFLMIVLIAPLIEEVIFRLPLNFKKTTLAISCATITFLLTGGSFLQIFSFSYRNIFSLIFAAMSLILVYRLVSSQKLASLQRHYFTQIFYSSSVLFGLVHILNIEEWNLVLLPVYPVYIIPQIIIGLFLATTRIQQGFAASWILHALINATSFLFT